MENNINRKYSVLMPVYYKDNPEWLRVAIDSMLNQTLPFDEFVIVKDGKITEELNEILQKYESDFPGKFKVIGFNENRGVGLASKYGIECCSNEYIAKIDSDDYSLPERIEKQFNIFEKEPDTDVVGCLVEEFEGKIDNIISHVILPERHDDIIKFAKKRCPVRHPALLFKKSMVLKAGNYRDIRIGEEYDLIVRMIMSGSKIYNIQYPYVHMRVNSNFYKRRGGIKFLKHIYKLKKGFKDIGFYSTVEFLYSFLGHAAVCLSPNFVRRFVYMNLLRKGR